MTKPLKAAQVYAKDLTASHLKDVFEEFISGGAAVGRDGLSAVKFGAQLDVEVELILRKIQNGTYSFTAYREKLISKGALKPPRQISIPTVRDKLVLKFLSEVLAQIFPEQVSRVPHSTVKRVHEASSVRPTSDRYLRLDIENFYPSIDHAILMRLVRRRIRKKELLRLIEDAITTPTGVSKHPDTKRKCGVPQGLSISNILAAIYLSDFDDEARKIDGIEYFRFVDDILMIGTEEVIKGLAASVPKRLKADRKIKCHKVGTSSKSAIIPLYEGVEYLGYRFCLSDIEVRDSSLKKMFSNVMKLISAMKYAPNKGPLIWRLNLRIAGCQFMGRRIGWLFFFSQSRNLRQLKQLDAFVASQAKRVLQPGDRERLKRFVKGYYEIRFSLETSGYFPNFDEFDDEQKREQVAILLPRKSRDEIDALTPKELDQLFRKCISREIADLEKDMMEVFS